MRAYIVIVPYRRNGRIRAVSYPASGCPLYTRAEAIALLQRFERRWGKQAITDELERYAESERERFGLADLTKS